MARPGATPNMIILKELYGRYDEGRAAEAITPGHIMMLNSDGELIKHNDAGGPGPFYVATEDSFLGRTIDDAYVADDLVKYWLAANGDEMYCFLDANEVAVIGSKLESAGNGNFQVHTTGVALAECVEAVDAQTDNTGTGTDNPITKRIKVRVA